MKTSRVFIVYPAHYALKLRMGDGRTAEMLRRDVGCDSDSEGPTCIAKIFEPWKDFFQAISLLILFPALSAGRAALAAEISGSTVKEP